MRGRNVEKIDEKLINFGTFQNPTTTTHPTEQMLETPFRTPFGRNPHYHVAFGCQMWGPRCSKVKAIPYRIGRKSTIFEGFWMSQIRVAQARTHALGWVQTIRRSRSRDLNHRLNL